MPAERFQDRRFRVDSVALRSIEALICVCDSDDPEDTPIVLLLKPSDMPWQRFFLDASFAVWAEADPLQVEDDCTDDSFRVVDLALKLGLHNATIHEAVCIQSRDTAGATEIILATTGGTLRLRHSDVDDWESRAEIAFELPC